MVGFYLKRTLKFFGVAIAFGTFALSLSTVLPMKAQAGTCAIGAMCVTTADCPANCSDCVQCIGGSCELDDTYCQDLSGGDIENQCRIGLCVNPESFSGSGCQFDAPAVGGDTSFEEICYYCDPPVLAVDTCGNGVCDSPGEDCSNCSLDCLTPGDTETCQDTTGQVCQQPADCADGEVCTVDFCDTAQLECANIATTCDFIAPDLCCPAGCEGIPPGFATCREAAAAGAIDRTICDPDCWPAQVCGDNFVQSNNGNPPETCDDGIPGPTAGLFPDGSTISEDVCRDPGTTDECTFCGDGIIQPASEDCDGTALGICDSCSDECACLTTDLIVQGSGPPWGPCSLNPLAGDHPRQGLFYLLALGIFLGLTFGLKRKFE